MTENPNQETVVSFNGAGFVGEHKKTARQSWSGYSCLVRRSFINV